MSTAATIGAVKESSQSLQIDAEKAAGTFVQIEPDAFLAILENMDMPLVVVAETGIFTKRKRYLTSYKGLAFCTDSPDKLPMPMDAELVSAKKIWVPGGIAFE